MNKIMKKMRKIKNLVYFKFKQKTFHSECKINYLLDENEASNQLIVSFAALPSKNRPATYQYMRTLEGEKVNKLFILDNYGPSISGGSFYLAKNKDFKIERSVAALIDKVAIDLNIVKKDIVTIGSSKGGFAAVYYAMKYQYGTVIAGEPQVYLGNYLDSLNSPSLLNYIMGSSKSENVEYLNALIRDTIKDNEQKTNVHLLCAQDGYYYKNHIAPFIKELNNHQIWNSLEQGQFTEHSDLGKHYPDYLLKTLSNLEFGID